MALLLNSVGHLLTDGVCAAALFGVVSAGGDMLLALPLYNTLAFSTQCIVGLFTDTLRRHSRLAGLGLALCCLGAALPLNYIARVVLLGLGNSLFHVAGGTVTLKTSQGRAWPLGVFVAPGAIGLVLGTLFPALLWWFVLPAAALSLALMLMREEVFPRCTAERAVPWGAVAALLVAVAVRAVGGSVVAFPWKTGPAMALLTVFFVFAGKTLGGFICDKLGARRTASLSIPLAAVLIAFCSQWAAPSIAGQLLLNLTMPVTLWLIYRAMPASPGLAFGLAASALWPGSITGGLITLTGPAASALTLICFVSGLAAILYATNKKEESL